MKMSKENSLQGIF